MLRVTIAGMTTCPVVWEILQDVRDFHHNQLDIILHALHPTTQEHVGCLTYALYEGIVRISIVHVEEKYRRCGVGRALVCALVTKYGWDKVNWGWLTGPGVKFKRAVKRELCRGLGLAR